VVVILKLNLSMVLLGLVNQAILSCNKPLDIVLRNAILVSMIIKETNNKGWRNGINDID
jgi:hypothetical protein